MPINNYKRAKQFISMDGMDFGEKVGPMDIDGFVEFGGEMFIFYEVKLQGAPLPFGQRLAYKHVVDAIVEAGKYAVVIVCDHDVYDCDNDVVLKDTLVRETYFGDVWQQVHHRHTAKEATTQILSYWSRLEEEKWTAKGM